MSDNIDKLKLIANTLLEQETLDAKEFAALLAGEGISTTDSVPDDLSQEGGSSSQDTPPNNVVPPSTAPLPA